MEMVHLSTTRGRRARRVRAAAVAAGVVAGALALAACGGGTSVGGKTDVVDEGSAFGFKTETQDDAAKITVWVDSTRQPAAEAYNKAHPDTPVKIVTYDGNANGSNTFKTKFQLFDRAGSGWPDVVFTTDNNSASWGSFSGTGALAALNKGLVPTDDPRRLRQGRARRRAPSTACRTACATTSRRTCSGTTRS